LGAQAAQQRGLLRFVHGLREPHTASRGIKVVETDAFTACPSPTMPACMAYVSTVTMMLCSAASVRYCVGVSPLFSDSSSKMRASRG
jgi:hypothetical protein